MTPKVPDGLVQNLLVDISACDSLAGSHTPTSGSTARSFGMKRIGSDALAISKHSPVSDFSCMLAMTRYLTEVCLGAWSVASASSWSPNDGGIDVWQV